MHMSPEIERRAISRVISISFIKLWGSLLKEGRCYLRSPHSLDHGGYDCWREGVGSADPCSHSLSLLLQWDTHLQASLLHQISQDDKRSVGECFPGYPRREGFLRPAQASIDQHSDNHGAQM